MNAEWDTIAWHTEMSREDNQLDLSIEGTLEDVDGELFERLEAEGVEVKKIVVEPEGHGSGVVARSSTKDSY